MNNKYLQKKSKQETAGKSDRQNRSEGHYARKKESFKEIPKWTPIAILVFTTLIYIKALFNDFAWDDEIYIMRNPFLRDFSINGIKVIFTSFYFSNFHPITTLTYFLEYKCFGINPFPYHLVNILLHLLNTWLVFKLVEQLSNKKITALVVSLLFAVHPMHVESVAWISERKDILYSLFYFLSLLSYLRYVKHGFSVKHYIWTLLFFIASLLSKSAAVTLPVLLIGIDIFRKRKITTKSLLEKVPFFMLSILFGILAILSQQLAEPSNSLSFSYSLIERIFLLSYSIVFYIIQFIAPFNLSAMHYLPDNNGGFLAWQYYASLPFLLFIIWLIFRNTSSKYRQTGLQKVMVSGFFFFLITISVMLYVPAGFTLTAERYTYIPYIGLFYIAGQWISNIREKQLRLAFFTSKNAVFAMFSVIIIVFSCLTWVRIGVWKNGDVLFTEVIKKNPYIFHGYMVRGNVKRSNGDYQDALKDYNKALEYKPGLVLCLINRGIVKINLNDYKGAMQDCNKAIALKPDFAEAYNNRGYVYYGLGDIKSAILDYNKAILLKPEFADAYNNRGLAYEGLSNMKSAIFDYSQSILLEPNIAKLYNNRGNAYFKTGNVKSAIIDYDKAILLEPEFAETYINRGIANEGLGNLKSAMFDYNKAIQLNPKSTKAYNSRCLLKINTKDISGALNDINIAITLSPDNAEAYSYRGIIKMAIQDYEGSIEDFNFSLKLNPNDNRVYYNRGISRLILKDTNGACDDWKKSMEQGNDAASQMIRQYCY